MKINDIIMTQIKPSQAFASAKKGILSAIRNNEQFDAKIDKSAIIGKALVDYRSTPYEVDLIFEGDHILQVLPPKTGNAVDPHILTGIQRSELLADGTKLPDGHITGVYDNGKKEFMWEASSLLQRRIGLKCKDMFFNGVDFFVYWVGSDAIAFMAKFNLAQEMKMIYWFDTTVHDYFYVSAKRAARSTENTLWDTRFNAGQHPRSQPLSSSRPRAKTLCPRRPSFLMNRNGLISRTLQVPME